uniref:Uncharacterized protein n=1 Tax=Florenciella parvula TaxID=236787 RepID=A0A7S2CLF4_9STRA
MATSAPVAHQLFRRRRSPRAEGPCSHSHTTFAGGMAQFIQRVATWLANEVVVKGLAENRQFQQFAVRTQSKLDNLKKEGVTKATDGIKNAEGVKNAQGIIERSLADANKFGSMLADEVKKDLAKAAPKK